MKTMIWSFVLKVLGPIFQQWWTNRGSDKVADLIQRSHDKIHEEVEERLKKFGVDIAHPVHNSEIYRSPNGTLFRVSVSDDGFVVAEKVQE